MENSVVHSALHLYISVQQQADFIYKQSISTIISNLQNILCQGNTHLKFDIVILKIVQMQGIYIQLIFQIFLLLQSETVNLQMPV